MADIAGFIFSGLSILILVATIIPLSPKEYWWIRGFDFPRLQIIFFGLVCLAGFIFFNNLQGTWSLIFEAALVIAIIYQAWRIFPYTVFAKKVVLDSTKSDKKSQIRIVVTNVLMTNRNYAACKSMIRKADPDVILAVETDLGWQQNLQELEKDYPYTLHCPLDNTYGMLLYSRLKLIDPQLKFLLESDIPSVHTQIELKTGERVVFHGLHPRPPAPQESETSVPRDAELIQVGLTIKENNNPTIVAGDLNDVAWSHTSKLFRKTSGLLDPRIGRGLFSTFHAEYKLLRWPLDHVFHTKDFKLISLKRLEYIGSDHFPICITLSYEPETKEQQEEPEVTAEDKEEAYEKLDKAAEMKQDGEIG